MMTDVIIIGTGPAGAAAARVLADAGKKVLMLERREHIGGNCYDYYDEHGILIHKYGPHIFHTEDESVFEFLARFTEWYMYPEGHRVVAKTNEGLIPIPFNMNTMKLVYGEEKANELQAKLIEAYGEGSRVPILKLRENEDADIRAIADYVYENVFLHYTMKQWGQTPDEISPEVTGRVPINISDDNRYFKDKYQGVPKDGFTAMYENMLDHDNILLVTDIDCREVLEVDLEENKIYVDEALVNIFDNMSDDGETAESEMGEEMVPFDGQVIYTGAIDELMDFEFGRLPYRSLRFDFEHLDLDDFQEGHSVVNYTVSEDFTRITEFKHLVGQKDTDGTTIVREYPFAYTGAEGEIPYYAIMNDENNALYEKYKTALSGVKNLYLLGRLAEYKYYNIDLMTAKAIELAKNI